ncbi:MAG: hypothetical protein IPL60_18470 [Ardenticatenia bacterium]|nr:hypothetical protein [Ardenticatenia bacterium]
MDRLQALRLRIHEHCAQAAQVADGIPWLGFVVWPNRRRVKARNVVKFDRRLGRLLRRRHHLRRAGRWGEGLGEPCALWRHLAAAIDDAGPKAAG